MKIANHVLAVLSTALVSGNQVTLVGHLDRALYQRTDKVLQAAGGKWDRKAKAHVFDTDAETRIDQIITTGEVVVPKDEYNYFPTPKKVVARLMKLACIKEGMSCLEPSAGQGAIAQAMEDEGGTVTCCELMPTNNEILRDMGFPMRGLDFLQLPADPTFDRVVMNPPFAKQADIHHVKHAHKFLAPGGLLVAVMSAGVLFRENRLTTEFRQWVNERDGTVEELPEGSFKESGTMVNTVVVVIPA